MRPETRKWIEQTPVEALLCRDLRHAWPRPSAAATGRGAYSDGRPPDGERITWKVLNAGGPTAPRVLERTMVCVCGVRRLEVFVVRDDRLVRTDRPKLKYPSWYRRTRAEPDEPLERLDADVLRGNIVARLYPGLKW